MKTFHNESNISLIAKTALIFSSGFAANQAVLFTLLAKNDLLVQDKLNHASLIEAGLLSPAQMKRFKHNDLLHLKTHQAPPFALQTRTCTKKNTMTQA